MAESTGAPTTEALSWERHCEIEIERQYRAAIEAAGIPERFRSAPIRRDLLLEVMGPRGDQGGVHGHGLYLHGPAGTGKTTAACGVLRGVIRSYSEASGDVLRIRRGGLYAKATGILSRYRSAMNGSGETEEVVTASLLEPWLLVIDDLGKERPTGWALSKLYEVIDMRYESMRPVVVTSQMSRGELAAAWSQGAEDAATAQALASRLSEMCRGVRFDGPDRRLG